MSGLRAEVVSACRGPDGVETAKNAPKAVWVAGFDIFGLFVLVACWAWCDGTHSVFGVSRD